MTAPDVPSREPAILYGIVADRIAELWSWRSWYRNHRWLRLHLLEADHRAELRALLRLAREARRQAEEAAARDAVWRTTMLTRPEQPLPFYGRDGEARGGERHGCGVMVSYGGAMGHVCPPESADPVTAAKGWQEAELREAWGR